MEHCLQELFLPETEGMGKDLQLLHSAWIAKRLCEVLLEVFWKSKLVYIWAWTRGCARW